MSDDWRCLFRHDTPWPELQRIIDEETQAALLTFLETLLNDPDFSDRDRARGWATAPPFIRRQTRLALEDGWHRLQVEMMPVSSPVH